MGGWVGGLGWVGLGWVGLGWVGLGWVGLGWVGLGWVGLGWVGLGWVGLGWVGLGWVGLGWWGGVGWVRVVSAAGYLTRSEETQCLFLMPEHLNRRISWRNDDPLPLRGIYFIGAVGYSI